MLCIAGQLKPYMHRVLLTKLQYLNRNFYIQKSLYGPEEYERINVQVRTERNQKTGNTRQKIGPTEY